MAEQELVDYIKKAKDAGQPDEQSRALLLKNGWTEAEVNDAFSALNQSLPEVQPQEPVVVAPKIEPAVQTQTITPQQPEVASQPQPQEQIVKEPKIEIQPQVQPQPSVQPAEENTMQKKKVSHLILKLSIILVAIVLLAGGTYFAIKHPNTNTQTKTQTKSNTNTNSNAAVNNLTEPAFANYNLEVTKYTPSLPDYKITMPELTNMANFEKSQNSSFSLAQTGALANDNFLIFKNNDKFYSTTDGSNRNDDWTGLYGQIGGSYDTSARNPENSVFITSDLLTHVYHKLIDEEFSYIEETNFYPTLTDLSKSLLMSSNNAYSKAQDAQQKDSYERLSAYFLVASAILDNASADYSLFQKQNFIADSSADTKTAILSLADSLAKTDNVSDIAKNTAKSEINLIFGANEVVESPLMGKYQPGMFEDYTQFTPRSHYTKNAMLRDYFRAMMFYGRMNFLLKSPELTRDAANISSLFTAGQLKQWESIYQPTAFFVGKSDDLNVYDYNQAAKKTSFSGADESDSAVLKLQNDLLTYKNPLIMSSIVSDGSVTAMTKEDLQNTTKGFRFMGQRFTPDAFIFSTLTQGAEAPDVKTGQKLPSTPTALMVSSLMGSKESASLLKDWVKDSAPDSDKVIADRMATLQDYFDKTTQQQWTQNIYWSWLYTIKSLFDNTAIAGFPVFMKSEDWNKKTLQGFLGSWTELKHNTLLYAKQSYAVAGTAGPEEPKQPKPVPKGYVEPNIDFLDRMITLINLTDDGLKQFGLLPANLESRNNTFKDSVDFYRTVVVAELENKVISDADFEKLRLSAGILDGILQAPDSQLKLESNARSAVIADVHTDALKGQILYEADGVPNYIYVAVKDANGTRLTKGLVYSYYEFTGPIGKRYTDQDWQKWNYSSIPQKLQMPWWNRDLVK